MGIFHTFSVIEVDMSAGPFRKCMRVIFTIQLWLRLPKATRCGFKKGSKGAAMDLVSAQTDIAPQEFTKLKRRICA